MVDYFMFQISFVYRKSLVQHRKVDIPWKVSCDSIHGLLIYNIPNLFHRKFPLIWRGGKKLIFEKQHSHPPPPLPPPCLESCCVYDNYVIHVNVMMYSYEW